MPKKSISSVELCAIVNELQFLVKGKVSQIYHQDKREMLLQLHAPGEGKQLVKIIPGKYLCITDTKDAPTRPTGFCMQLRKYLSNAFIKSITQYESQRIIVFEFEKEEIYYFIVELFSKGNIVLTDSNHKIIATLMWQKWKDRTVKPGEQYVFPASDVNWKKMSEKDFTNIIQKSEKKNIATTLATEIGLGGVYAEEICILCGVDKDIIGPDLHKPEIARLFEQLQVIARKLEQPAGYVYGDEDITPFALFGKKEDEKTQSYSKALDKINPFQIISPYQKRIIMMEKMVGQQRDAIKAQEEEVVKNTQKAELIYENYAPLQKMLDAVNAMKKDTQWSEIGDALKKEKKIISVDLKKKSVVIDL